MEALAARLVQQVSENGAKVPERYIQKEKISEAIDASDELWNDTLLIDFSLLSSDNPDNHELQKFKSALSTWGCFLVKNHGMETSFLEEFLEVSRQFYALPVEEKLKSSSAHNRFHGYGTDSAGIGTQIAWNDRMYLVLHPEEKRSLHLWPQNPPKFREMLNEYAEKLLIVIEGIYKALARSLKLKDEEFFKNQMKGGLVTGRLTMYPPCPCPERVIGILPHSDGSLFTALLGETGVDGLQIKKDDQWYKVPAFPGYILVNIGDFGEVTTNGMFKSAVHRVATNPKGRISWASFCFPGGDIEVGPLKECITPEHPQIYRKTSMAEFDNIIRDFKKERTLLECMKL